LLGLNSRLVKKIKTEKIRKLQIAEVVLAWDRFFKVQLRIEHRVCVTNLNIF